MTDYIVLAIIVGALIFFVSKAVIATYFRRKEEFVDRLVKKGKDHNAKV